jgi:exosortase/archaeosortase family protein
MKAVLANFKQEYKKTPKAVRRFIKGALLLFVAWQLLYHFLLEPYRIPDGWLTGVTARATAWVWSFFEPGMWVLTGNPMDYVVMRNTRIVGIADGCNALEIYILYVAFLICYPVSSWKKVLLMGVGGVAGIAVLNVARCTAIGWLNLYHPQWVDFAHHYAFTLIVYAFVFLLWRIYVRTEDKKTAEN